MATRTPTVGAEDPRHLLLHRSGNGAPSAVFVPGAGLVGLDYLKIRDQVSQLTTSVLYDRRGTGWSDALELPRTATAVTDELRELLRAPLLGNSARSK